MINYRIEKTVLNVGLGSLYTQWFTGHIDVGKDIQNILDGSINLVLKCQVLIPKLKNGIERHLKIITF